MFIDTHAHLGSPAFKNDVGDVITRALKEKVWLISPGYNYSTSKAAVELAQKYSEGVYSAIGLHPTYIKSGFTRIKQTSQNEFQPEKFDYEKYRILVGQSNVVAIGEFGLDYYWKPKTKIKLERFKEEQRELFLKHIKLAAEFNLPLIMHCRMANRDLIEILRYLNHIPMGVLHCFTGSWPEAKMFLEMGFYLGFNGIIFKLDLNEVIKKIPADKILFETDAPDLTPPPLLGRNEPINIKYIAEKIAAIKRLSSMELAEIATRNAKALFRI